MSDNRFQYALVARGTTPLAEYSLVDGNYRNIALKILDSVDINSPHTLVELANSVFFSTTDKDKMTFLCLCSAAVTAAHRESFLEELNRKWYQKYGNNGDSFAPNSKNNEFGENEIKSLLIKFNSERYIKIAQAKQNLKEAQDQMTQNLTLAFARGEHLNIMDKKAENLRESAQDFHREAKRVKKAMCCQKWRWYIIGGVIIVVAIFAIVVVACGGFTFKKCRI